MSNIDSLAYWNDSICQDELILYIMFSENCYNKGHIQLSYEVSWPLSIAATVHSVCFIAVFIASALMTLHILQF